MPEKLMQVITVVFLLIVATMVFSICQFADSKGGLVACGFAGWLIGVFVALTGRRLALMHGHPGKILWWGICGLGSGLASVLTFRWIEAHIVGNYIAVGCVAGLTVAMLVFALLILLGSLVFFRQG